MIVNGKSVICPVTLAYDPEFDHYHMKGEEHDEILKAFENELRRPPIRTHQVRRQVTHEMAGNGTVTAVVQPEELTDSSLRRSKGPVIKYLLQGGGGYRPGPPKI